MLISVEGVYENNTVRLLEPIPGIARARVVVTVLPDSPLPLSAEGSVADDDGSDTAEKPIRSLTGDAVVDHYQPRTELGRKLIELRRAYIEEGGTLASWEDIDADARERRGGVNDG